MRKRRVAGRIYGTRYSCKGHKDRKRHKNRIKGNGQAPHHVKVSPRGLTMKSLLLILQDVNGSATRHTTITCATPWSESAIRVRQIESALIRDYCGSPLPSICSCLGAAGPTDGVAGGDQESAQNRQEVLELFILTVPQYPVRYWNVPEDHWRHPCCGLERIAYGEGDGKIDLAFEVSPLAFQVVGGWRWNLSADSAIMRFADFFFTHELNNFFLSPFLPLRCCPWRSTSSAVDDRICLLTAPSRPQYCNVTRVPASNSFSGLPISNQNTQKIKSTLLIRRDRTKRAIFFF